MEEFRIGNFCDLIDFTVEQQSTARNFYVEQYKKTGRSDIKSLILSLLEQNKEQAKQFAEIKQRGNVESLFDSDLSGFKIEDFRQNLDYKAGNDYLNYLSSIVHIQDITMKLNSFLMKHCKNADIQFLFKSMAEENGKQKQIFLDRYELELIKQVD